MTEATLNFTYEGSTIKIQCKRDEYMKDIFKRYANKISKDANDIYFTCKGSLINEESKLEEINKKDNEIEILVNDISDKKNENKAEIIKHYKDVICPECGEACLIDIKDYKITLNKCSNNHSLGNILLDEFNDLQKYNELDILCDICNSNNKSETYNNKFFKCYNCIKNICPLCKSKHNKAHILLDYDLKNYSCNTHGKNYISYCEECKKNLCIICEIEHKKHNYNSLNKLITDKENNINELRLKIDNLKKDIKDIIDKLNKIVDNFEIYYNINNNIINNYNIENKNYEILVNINNIYNFNEKAIKDINEIINENKIENKIKYLYSIYDKMITTNEIIIKYCIGKEDKIRIFGDKFVENNKSNFQMIINDNSCELSSFYNIKKEKEKENEVLEIKLKQTNDITNISQMFIGCSSLIELPDISKLNTNNVIDMSYIFCQCNELSSLPDISKWNTKNVTNITGLFQQCSSLTELPDIR